MDTRTPREEALDKIEDVRAQLREINKNVRTGRLNWRQEQALTRSLDKCISDLAPKVLSTTHDIRQDIPEASL